MYDIKPVIRRKFWKLGRQEEKNRFGALSWSFVEDGLPTDNGNQIDGKAGLPGVCRGAFSIPSGIAETGELLYNRRKAVFGNCP